jgi:hypothetical protein
LPWVAGPALKPVSFIDVAATSGGRLIGTLNLAQLKLNVEMTFEESKRTRTSLALIIKRLLSSLYLKINKRSCYISSSDVTKVRRQV